MSLKKVFLAFFGIGIGVSIIFLSFVFGYETYLIKQSNQYISKGEYNKALEIINSPWILFNISKKVDLIDLAKKLSRSNDYFQQALKLKETLRYRESCLLLKKIDPRYYRYSEAKKFMLVMLKDIKEKKLRESKTYEKEGNTLLALAKISDVLTIDSSDLNFVQRKNVLVKKIITEMETGDQTDYISIGRDIRAILRIEPDNKFALAKREFLKGEVSSYQIPVEMDMANIMPAFHDAKESLEKNAPLKDVLKTLRIVQPLLKKAWQDSYDYFHLLIGVGEDEKVERYFNLNKTLESADSILEILIEQEKYGTIDQSNYVYIDYFYGLYPPKEYQDFYWDVKWIIEYSKKNY